LIKKRLFYETWPVRIRAEIDGSLTLIPQIFRKRTLAGLESLGKETYQSVPKESPPEVFLEAFDKVLAISSTQ
jgi:hypothetical protein